MELDEALAKILELEQTTNTLKEKLEIKETEISRTVEEKEKLASEVKRVQERNLEFFNLLEKQTLDTMNNSGQANDAINKVDEKVPTIDDIVSKFL